MTARRASWVALLFVALLWSSRSLAAIDGAPLDQPLEAVVIALVVPALLVLAASFVDTMPARGLIVALLLVKIAGTALITQGGWCAQFRLDAPLHGAIPPESAGAAQAVAVDEPYGVLHSWDVRADWRNPRSSCTAIVGRAYPSTEQFPAWFLNLVRHVDPPRHDLSMTVHGFVSPRTAGILTIATGDTILQGSIGGQPIPAVRGGVRVALDPGVHDVSLTMALPERDWTFVPRWNDRNLWSAVSTTTGRPTAIEVALWPAHGWLVTAIGLLLVGAWAGFAVRQLQPARAALVCAALASIVMVLFARSDTAARFAGPLLMAAAVVPVPPRLKNLRGAFLLVGVPWLVFFGAHTFGQIGRITLYSADDWLTYQAAAHRIFVAGYWLEGGNAVFNYQPLYRWMTGALHLVFGDSSVGEAYWDAACLLVGALLSFVLVDDAAGFRWGMVAAGATLATFTLGTTWHFIGRGLSEIAAAGWAFIAALCLLRAPSSGLKAPIAAGVAATLMFYTRLNHLLFAFALAALLLPVDATSWRRAAAAMRTRAAAAACFVSTFAAGIALLALRTWRYTGVVNPFYGTSLSINDTGLRPWTLTSGAMWQRVLHSVSALVLMNEPPRLDLRAVPVLAGVTIAALALMHVPPFTRVPLRLSVACLGGVAAALFAHTHNYPGRMSIHLVPFAVATVVCAVAIGSRARQGSPA